MEAMIPTLLGWAVLLPLLSFVAILLAGPKMGKHGSFAAWVATFAIGTAAVLSLVSLKIWVTAHPVVAMQHGDHGETGHGQKRVER